jgi:hypothetical protein
MSAKPLSKMKKVTSSTLIIIFIIEKDKNFDEDDNDIMSHLNYRKLEEIKKDFMKNEE